MIQSTSAKSSLFFAKNTTPQCDKCIDLVKSTATVDSSSHFCERDNDDDRE